VAAEAAYPREDSAASLEGTLAHEVAEAILLGTVPPAHPPEMEGPVQEYVDYVLSLGTPDRIEHKVDLGPFIPGCFGTADAIVIETTNGETTIHVVDLKYGKGVPVEAEENEQLEAYGLGVAHEYEWAEPDKVVCHIVQPRLGIFESWTIPSEELPLRGARLRAQAQMALLPDAPRKPGEKQCRFCKHRRHSPELAEHNQAEVTGLFEPIEEVVANPLEVRVVADADVPALLPKLDLIEGWCRGIRERAWAIACRGELAGYKFVAGRSTRKWDNEEAVIEMLRAAGRDPAELLETRLISPAQAEKVLGKKDPVLLEHVVKPPGKPTLAPVSDKRPAVDPPGTEANLFNED
jgi:hypothetical protein